jgi:5'-3' exonuclease
MTNATKQDRVLLVDGMNTYIRSWMIIPITNDDGEHFGGVFGFLKSLKAAVDKFKPTEVVICWDGPHSGLRRKNLFPAYKANRKKDWRRGSVKAFDFMSEEEQSSNFVMQVQRVQDYLDQLPVKVLRIPYVEADDIIAVYAQELNEKSQVIIYSSDADFKQLITDTVHTYNPISKKYLTRQTFREEVGIDPKNYIIFKSTSGDKSDNIPGVRGLGEKTVMNLFPEVAGEEIIDINDMLEKAKRLGFDGERRDLSKGMLNKYKFLAEHGDELRRNYRLMQLTDPEISNTAKEIVLRSVYESPQPFMSLQLKMMFIQDKLEKTVRRFDDWAHTFAGLQTR